MKCNWLGRSKMDKERERLEAIERAAKVVDQVFYHDTGDSDCIKDLHEALMPVSHRPTLDELCVLYYEEGKNDTSLVGSARRRAIKAVVLKVLRAYREAVVLRMFLDGLTRASAPILDDEFIKGYEEE
jgi:hypothetical protein